MNYSALSFRDLEYIVALATHLHFGKAANACAVSQPTLSTQLRKFEEYFGFEIFERTGRTVLVTERGAEIVAQARIILHEARRLSEIIEGGGEMLSGSFRLGVIATLGPYITPLLLPPLREKFPRLRLIMTEGLRPHLEQALAGGEIDALLAAAPLRDDFTALSVFQEDLVLAVPRGHRLGTAAHVTLADIDFEELILLNEGDCLRSQTLSLFPAMSGGRDLHGLQAASLESMRQMVAAGLGCALIPRLAVQFGSLLDDMVAYRMIRDFAPRRAIAMFHRASFARIREARALREVIRDVLRNTGSIDLAERRPLANTSPTGLLASAGGPE